MMDFTKLVKTSIIGSILGDALGVPYEFQRREELKNITIDMLGGGTHAQPPGTWSDDSSMLIASLDSLAVCKGFDDLHMMSCFVNWFVHKHYTPLGEVFDIGATIADSIERYLDGASLTECGGADEWDNGNGALMRMLPVVLCYYARYGSRLFGRSGYGDMPLLEPEAIEQIRNCIRLTHRHPRNVAGCLFYALVVCRLLDGKTPRTSLRDAILKINRVLNDVEKSEFNQHYPRLSLEHWFENNGGAVLPGSAAGQLAKEFIRLDETAIKSEGYIVETLEAALWCLLNTKSYEECVVKAVKLGYDTDTVASIAGGLAGVVYAEDPLPQKWLDKIVKLDYINNIIKEFTERVVK